MIQVLNHSGVLARARTRTTREQAAPHDRLLQRACGPPATRTHLCAKRGRLGGLDGGLRDAQDRRERRERVAAAHAGRGDHVQPLERRCAAHAASRCGRLGVSAQGAA